MIENLTLILLIANQIAQTPYDLLRYNCWDYATDLKIELAKYNYSSRIAHGIVNCSSELFDYDICKSSGGSHSWLEINSTWIEATTGQLITDRTPYHLGYLVNNVKWNPYKLRYLQQIRKIKKV
jgi:hypothetical protein